MSKDNMSTTAVRRSPSPPRSRPNSNGNGAIVSLRQSNNADDIVMFKYFHHTKQIGLKLKNGDKYKISLKHVWQVFAGYHGDTLEIIQELLKNPDAKTGIFPGPMNDEIIKRVFYEVDKHVAKELESQFDIDVPYAFSLKAAVTATKSQYFNNELYNILAAYIRRVLFSDSDSQMPLLLGDWLSNTPALSEGMYGKVRSLTMRGDYTPAVSKLATNPQDTLDHEYTVGLLLNKIKQNCPNFVYTYLLTSCSEEGDRWCRMKDIKNRQLLTEFVRGEALHNEIAHMDQNMIISCLLQIASACHVAYSLFRFNHQDLHTGNILVTAVQPGWLRYYITPDKPWYVYNYGVRVTIIDYGFAMYAVRLPSGEQVDIPPNGEPFRYSPYVKYNMMINDKPVLNVTLLELMWNLCLVLNEHFRTLVDPSAYTLVWDIITSFLITKLKHNYDKDYLDAITQLAKDPRYDHGFSYLDIFRRFMPIGPQVTFFDLLTHISTFPGLNASKFIYEGPMTPKLMLYCDNNDLCSVPSDFVDTTFFHMPVLGILYLTWKAGRRLSTEQLMLLFVEKEQDLSDKIEDLQDVIDEYMQRQHMSIVDIMKVFVSYLGLLKEYKYLVDLALRVSNADLRKYDNKFKELNDQYNKVYAPYVRQLQQDLDKTTQRSVLPLSKALISLQ